MEPTDSLPVATREVFGNIAPWMRLVFYGLIAASMAVLAAQIGRRVRLWRRGQPGGFERDWRVWVRRIGVYALAQKRVHRKSLGAALHVLLFSGFVVLTIGTTLLMIADQGPVNFHRGLYYLVYELVMDVFGVALCAGCLLAFHRRLFRRPATLGHQTRDWWLLALLLALGITGFAVEALRLRYSQVDPGIARWSVVGQALNRGFLGNLDLEKARDAHLAVWWIHAFLVAALFVSLPVTRFLHVLTGPLNIATRPERPAGALVPASLEEVETTGRVGVAAVEHFTRQQLLSLDACMECGRCEEACPATASGKPLSPKRIVLDLRQAMARMAPAAAKESLIAPDTLWACTKCQACVQECPVLIGHVDLINDMRRNLVAEGQLSGPPAKALAGMGRYANPYGRPESERLAWTSGLQVPTVSTQPDFELLLWVGCAGAFDPRAQKVVRALTRLLQQAGVRFAILGPEERCTGDSARRLGDEFLFQELARANVETLQRHRVRRIVTSCPHCLNTLKNEYPQFGGHFEVRHHSQLLAELVAAGRLSAASVTNGTVTLHDPCYLARVNAETTAPRDVLRAAGAGLREMPRHGARTFCCGAGGGRMWFDEPPAQRVSRLRAREVRDTGAPTLATACPFCLNMMSDAMATPDPGSAPKGIEVLDIAEILERHQPPRPGATGTPPQAPVPPPSSTVTRRHP